VFGGRRRLPWQAHRSARAGSKNLAT